MKRFVAAVLLINMAVLPYLTADASTTKFGAAINAAYHADKLLHFKSCGKNCESATDKYDYDSVTVRDGLIVMEFEPLMTVDATGNLTGASYAEIALEKGVLEHYCGVAGWNWLIAPHGAFYRWGTSNNADYITWTNINHHHLAFAADNQTATYTITVTL